MKRIWGKHGRWSISLAATLLLLSLGQAIAQNDSTATSTITSTQTQTDELLKGTEFQNKRDIYNGMGEGVNVRKDAWNWYWNEKGHLDVDPDDKAGLWGNDGISLFFKGIADNALVPFWNGAMQYDFVRAALLLVLAGMLLGLGASIMMPSKEQK